MATADVHADLRRQFQELQHTYDSMLSWEPDIPKPPLIDSFVDSTPSHRDNLPGHRAFFEAVERDLDVMEKFLTDPKSDSRPPLSTNALYLISVWQELLLAPPPAIAIAKNFHHRAQNLDKPSLFDPSSSTGKQVPVKIDVVADNGRTWIRVNTTKNARLLTEFREIDSYFTDSESDSDFSDPGARPSLAQKEFDNSILRQGRALLAAATQNPLPFTSAASSSLNAGSLSRPKVIFRLTRLDPNSPEPRDNDPRIALTIRMLEEMGIEVQLGQRPSPLSLAPSTPATRPSRVPKVFKPTRQINLDLSVLIALVSDLTHAPLPSTEAEAEERFVPSKTYLEWKKLRLRAKIHADKPKNKERIASPSPSGNGARIDGDDGEGEGENEAEGVDGGNWKHLRALAEQLKQEMKKGLLEEMKDRLSDPFVTTSSPPSPYSLEENEANLDVAFWTTPEARDRFLRIVSKIGGSKEKRRAHALFDSSSSPSSLSGRDAEEVYWQDSRYPRNYIPLYPIHVFPVSNPAESKLQSTESVDARAPFFRALEKTCRSLLAEQTAPHPKTLPRPFVCDSGLSTPSVETSTSTLTTPTTATGDVEHGDENGLGGDEIQRASVMKANPKLTAHTVLSMLWGAVSDEGYGWTTITANKASVRAMIREMKSRSGVVPGGDWMGGSGKENAPVSRPEQDVAGSEGYQKGAVVGRAAIWTVDPRSLAEGMRSDYTP